MKKILLPFDGSVRSLRTIDMVQQIYPNREVEVTLLMVLPDQMHIDGRLAGAHRAPLGQPRAGDRPLRPGGEV